MLPLSFSSLFTSSQGRTCLRRSCSVLAGAALFLPGGLTPAQAPATLTISPRDIVSPVSPTLYGMMTEEINHAFEGGLYAEMVQNRTFRGNWSGIERWALVRRGEANATMDIDKSTGPSTAIPYSLKLTVETASPHNEAGISNAGYWGMGVKPGTKYNGSFYAKIDGSVDTVLARLVSDDSGETVGEARVPVHAGDWARYEYALTTNGSLTPSPRFHLQILLTQPGTVHLQEISLFPPTFHNQPNGFRPDLMERMAGLHPNFLRLPGGNYLEGDTLADWYDWKKTIGPVVDRPGHQAPWTYWSNDGLGLLEFLQWTEDLHIEPLLAVYAGYALKGEHINPGPDLQPYVQSALDEIEYVTGGPNTHWGAERAKDGHPAPFPLHYIEIGNEDWFDKSGSYDARFAQIAQAIRKQYGTKYKLIATTPVKETAADAQPDVLDDHYYKPVGEMLDFTHHYDNAPRTGPKIFVGEWATLSGTPTPDFGGALADAAFMTSLERNSDLIIMASYAPLFININPGAGQWYTNMIGYDASTSYGSPSYYAQCLFGAHLGDGTPKTTLQGAGKRFSYSATVGSHDHVLHLKMVNASTEDQPLTVNLQGVNGSHAASMSTLHGGSYEATNSITAPDLIHPTTSQVSVPGSAWQHTVPALTIEVIDIPLR